MKDASTLSSNELQQTESGRHAQSYAGDTTTTSPTDPQQVAELRLLELAWPHLAKVARQRILAIVADANRKERR